MLLGLDIVILSNLLVYPSSCAWSQRRIARYFYSSVPNVNRSLRRLEQSTLIKRFNYQNHCFYFPDIEKAHGFISEGVPFTFYQTLEHYGRGLPVGELGDGTRLVWPFLYVCPPRENEFVVGWAINPLYYGIPHTIFREKDVPVADFIKLIEISRIPTLRNSVKGKIDENFVFFKANNSNKEVYINEFFEEKKKKVIASIKFDEELLVE